MVLSRKKGESIMIGDHIELIILGTEGDSVRIGINAPKHIEIHRKEVFIAIKQSNEEASKSRIALTALGELFKKRDQ
nr:carbon storage regulator CsrA [Paenibacillus hamazuiensis]